MGLKFSDYWRETKRFFKNAWVRGAVVVSVLATLLSYYKIANFLRERADDISAFAETSAFRWFALGLVVILILFGIWRTAQDEIRRTEMRANDLVDATRLSVSLMTVAIWYRELNDFSARIESWEKGIEQFRAHFNSSWPLNTDRVWRPGQEVEWPKGGPLLATQIPEYRSFKISIAFPIFDVPEPLLEHISRGEIIGHKQIERHYHASRNNLYRDAHDQNFNRLNRWLKTVKQMHKDETDALRSFVERLDAQVPAALRPSVFPKEPRR